MHVEMPGIRGIFWSRWPADQGKPILLFSISAVAQELLSARLMVYDVVYNPIKTPLLKMAESMGAGILGGLSMLVYQGVAAFELWTEKRAPVDIMMQKARSAF